MIKILIYYLEVDVTKILTEPNVFLLLYVGITLNSIA